MQYEPAPEKEATASEQKAQRLAKENLNSNPHTRSIRIKLIVIIAIQLVLVTLHSILQIYDIIMILKAVNGSKDILTTRFIIRILFILNPFIYILTLIMVIKYIWAGILICTWIIVIQLIGIYFLITIGSLTIAIGDSITWSVSYSIKTQVFTLTVMVVASILSILIIIFSFKLIKWLHIQEDDQDI